MYRYLRQRLKHVVRFRNKRGYGVHSPFMFNLILNVIRDKERQFRYPEILEKQEKLKHQEKKTYRLLFRLSHYLMAKNVVCFGKGAEKLAAYLTQGDVERKAVCNPGNVSSADFIYLGRDACQFLPDDKFCYLYLEEKKKCCIVVADIYRNRFNMQLWRQLKEKSTVSVDMMWYGILLFDDKLQKGKYNLII